MNVFVKFFRNPFTEKDAKAALRLCPLHWKILLGVLIILTPILGWSDMLYSQRAIDSASPIPTIERPMPMMDHGRTLYVTAEQDHTLGILTPAMMLATFATIATGFYVTGYLRHVARIFFEENDKAEIKS